MAEQINVRVGTPEDLDGIMEIARLIHDEIGITALDPQKILPEIWAALNLDRGIMGVIGEPGAEPEGAILPRFGKLFYSDEDVLEDKGLFVRPDFRKAKGGRGRILCEFAKQAADDLGLPLLIGYWMSGTEEDDGKRRLYERQFGEPAGQFFLYRGKGAVQ